MGRTRKRQCHRPRSQIKWNPDIYTEPQQHLHSLEKIKSQLVQKHEVHISAAKLISRGVTIVHSRPVWSCTLPNSHIALWSTIHSPCVRVLKVETFLTQEEIHPCRELQQGLYVLLRPSNRMCDITKFTSTLNQSTFIEISFYCFYCHLASVIPISIKWFEVYR